MTVFMSTPPPVLILDIGFMTILLIVAFAIIRMRSLFAIVMLQGVYSLVSAAWFVSLDAVDVAFTEAAVGAGISTVLMLSAMLLADRQSAPVAISRYLGAFVVSVIGVIALLYAVPDMPAFGDAASPANTYVGMEYMTRAAEEVHVPNVVTAVLASYRGYDTFGEAVVIFSAGLGVLLLLGLNGNAGRHWSAKPNGVSVASVSAPMSITRAQQAAGKIQAAQTVKAAPKKKTAPPKKASSPKKPAAKSKVKSSKAKSTRPKPSGGKSS